MDRRAINKTQLLEIVPLSSTSIYELEQKGDFPKRFYLTARTPAWDYDEVQTWLTNRRTNPIPKAATDTPDVHTRKRRPVKTPKRA